MRFSILGSGSKGNGTVVELGDTRLLIDCGFGLRDTISRLETIGLALHDLSAILVTHEHGDHSKGVDMIARRAQIPVYLSVGTFEALTDRDKISQEVKTVFIDLHKSFNIGKIKVNPVAVPHDAREASQFIFHGNDKILGLLTDVGSITPYIVDKYQSCDSLILEFNHDQQMLRDGPYPYALQLRVGGKFGHLSNDQAQSFLKQISLDQMNNLVIAHMSEQNNAQTLVQKSIEEVVTAELLANDLLTYAQQGEITPWMDV